VDHRSHREPNRGPAVFIEQWIFEQHFLYQFDCVVIFDW
jgi:hypothetical protein